MSGVTYYKLEQRYEGDVTKGCGLTSAEVDANFHFLRGYDIKDVTLSEEGVLTFHRVNCDDIVITNLPEIIERISIEAFESMDEPLSLSGTTYDPETGELTIILNGSEIVVPGFKDTEFDFKLYVGQGINGDGTKRNPIRLSVSNATGFFAPVECVLEDGELVGSHTRFITKDKTSRYGLLYNPEQVALISAYLAENGKGWRVPTEEDWEDLLSAVCDNAFDLKHESFESDENLKKPSYFEALPIEYTRVGSQNKKSCVFWTATDMHGKKLLEGSGEVTTAIGDANTSWSIRLVKDNNYPVSDAEEICGQVYNTVQIGSLVWTVDNLFLDGEEIFGTNRPSAPYGEQFVLKTEEEYRAESPEKYFVNVYDSVSGEFSKKELPVNGVVMIEEYSGYTNSEWIVVKNDDGTYELKNRTQIFLDAAVEIANAYTDELADRVESLETVSADTRLAALEEVSADTRLSALEEVSADTRLSALEEVSADTRIQELEEVSADTRLNVLEEASADTRIKALETVSADTRIQKLEEVSADTRIQKLEEVSADTRIQEVERKSDKNESDIADIKNQIGQINESGLSAISYWIEAADETFDAISGSMITKVTVNGEPLEKVDNAVDIEVPVSGIASDDKFLTLSDKNLKVNFTVDYDADEKAIKFFGKNENEPFYTIDTSDFVKDGILERATVEYNTEGKKVLRLFFNTESGQEPVDIELTDLVTEYTVARGSDDYLEIDGFEIAFKPEGLSNLYAAVSDLQALSATTLAMDKKIGPGFKDEHDANISVTHKVTELERALEDFTKDNLLEFEEDFTVAGIIGTLGTGYYQNGSVIPAGTKVMDVIKNILQKELDPVGIAPSVTLEFVNAGEYEIGTNVAPMYRINFNKGLYTYLDGTSGDTGFRISRATVQLYDNGALTPNPQTGTPTGTFDSYTVSDGTVLTMQANIDYESTVVPNSNLGNPRPDSKMPDGRFEFVQSTNTITVYRPIYYAVLSDDDAISDLNAALLRNNGEITITPSELSTQFTKHDKNEIPGEIAIAEGTEAVIILVPNTNAHSYKINEIIDTDSGFELSSRFEKMNTSINGAGYSAYVFDPESQEVGPTTYEIISTKTLKKPSVNG
ncbi:MAG: hypothetical protein J6Y37_10265 [Paludibacteraceae bacterium]|nr:hypothetical protein [Paludibacteraceae bacterium]